MYKIHEFLSKLGLNGKETKTYLALLRYGAQPASVIGKKIQIPRSTALFSLNSLVKKGLAKKEILSSTNYFAPVPPRGIKELIKRKQKKMEANLEELDKLIPDFDNIVKQVMPRSSVQFFEGVEGVCKMIDKLMEKDIPVYFISGHKFHPEIRAYIRDNWIESRKKMKTKCQMIVHKHYDSENYVKTAKGVYEWVGFAEMRDKKYAMELTIAIYGNKVQFLSCAQDDLIGVLIENEYLANTLLAVFMMLKNTQKVEAVYIEEKDKA